MEKDRYSGPGVVVYEGIKLNGRTDFPIFDTGYLTGDRYGQEVILLHVRLFRDAIEADFLFMDHHAQPYRTHAVQQLQESEYIARLDWPAYSPDLNPIEHMWDALGKHIAQVYIPWGTPRTERDPD